MTKLELRGHMQPALHSDDDVGFRGHPNCGFCSKQFYDDDDLFHHCRDQHEICFLCERAGIRFQYYKNYDELEYHFHGAHFPCLEKACLEKKFVVFPEEIDLKAHQLEHKRGSGRRAAIPISMNLTFNGGPGSHRSSSSRATAPSRSRPTSSDGSEVVGALGVCDVTILKISEAPRQSLPGRGRNIIVPSGFGAQLSVDEPTPSPMLIISTVDSPNRCPRTPSPPAPQHSRASSASAKPSLSVLEDEADVKRKNDLEAFLSMFLSGHPPRSAQFFQVASTYFMGEITSREFFDKFDSLLGPAATTSQLGFVTDAYDMLPNVIFQLYENVDSRRRSDFYREYQKRKPVWFQHKYEMIHIRARFVGRL